MIGFLLYFATAVGMVFPVALSVIDGKTAWGSIFTPAFLGPPGLLGIAAFLAVFAPRLAGLLAFSGCVACWINSGTGIIQSLQALITSGNLQAVVSMATNALLKYLLGWMPTLGLILSTFYSFYRALKLPRHSHSDEITVGAPPPQGVH